MIYLNLILNVCEYHILLKKKKHITLGPHLRACQGAPADALLEEHRGVAQDAQKGLLRGAEALPSEGLPWHQAGGQEHGAVEALPASRKGLSSLPFQSLFNQISWINLYCVYVYIFILDVYDITIYIYYVYTIIHRISLIIIASIHIYSVRICLLSHHFRRRLQRCAHIDYGHADRLVPQGPRRPHGHISSSFVALSHAKGHVYRHGTAFSRPLLKRIYE